MCVFTICLTYGKNSIHNSHLYYCYCSNPRPELIVASSTLDLITVCDAGPAAGKSSDLGAVQPVAHGLHAAQDGYECSPTQNHKLT